MSRSIGFVVRRGGVARVLSPSSFTDASCSSATTADMTQSQSPQGGLQTAPPQFNALDADDALVTVGIGGNDVGLVGVAEACASSTSRAPSGPRARTTTPRAAAIPTGTAWVNGIVPTSLAYPLHPNQAGEQNMANQVLADR